jgi:non-heme chloroperoxidase
VLLNAGYRVITYDLRGFGASSQPSFGYDYDTFAANLNTLMAPVPPFLLKTNDNPEGVDQSVFDGIMKAIVEDRPAYFSEFFKAFFNVDVLLGKRISNDAIQASWNVAVGASTKGTLDCVPSWLTDFRDDLPRIDVPTLIIHGDADRILPLESTAARLPKLIKNSQLVVIPGGPHAINWTHADQINP